MERVRDNDRVARVVREHGALLLRVARQYSLCADDAQDACQRALEIFWKRLDAVEEATEVAWLKVVVKHEALAVRRARGDWVGGEEHELELLAGGDGRRGADEGLAAAERVRRSAEVLRGLKRDEATALLLKAEGHSYQEIGARQGWTYTKVNRAVTEGRRRFMRLYEEIEAGAACERYEDTLRALAAGTIGIAELRELRPHLRHCARCKATLRELRLPTRRRLAALMPLPVPLPLLLGGGGGAPQPAPPLQRLKLLDLKDHSDEFLRRPPRARLHALIHRLHAADAPAQAHLLAGTGGGRGAAVAALLGLCLSGGAAGVYCAATGVTDAVRLFTDRPHRPAHAVGHRPAAHHPAHAQEKPAPAETAWRRPPVVPTPAPTPSPTPHPSSKPRPHATAASAPANPEREFGFEQGGGSSAPASSDATSASGNEFGAAPARSASASGGEFLP